MAVAMMDCAFASLAELEYICCEVSIVFGIGL